MSRELFQELRTHLMERLDLARELSDEEILDEIDDLILGRMREYGLSLKEKVQLRPGTFSFCSQTGCFAGTDRG